MVLSVVEDGVAWYTVWWRMVALVCCSRVTVSCPAVFKHTASHHFVTLQLYSVQPTERKLIGYFVYQ